MLSFDVLVQSVVSGLAMGAVYALVASGLGIVFGVLRIVNFAHGEFVMLGMLAAYYCQAVLGWPLLVVLPVSAVVFFLAGAVLEIVLVESTLAGDPETQMLLTLGLAAVIEGACTLLLDPRYRILPASATNTVVLHIGPIALARTRVTAFAAGVALSLLLAGLLSFTTHGKILRAVAEDPSTATMLGVRPGFYRSSAMGVGVALAGVAGVLVLPFLHVASYLGIMFTLKAFLLVVAGGMGRPLLILLVGLLMGGIEGASAALLSDSVKEVPVLLVFIVIMGFASRSRRPRD